jgi:hypothetical protein
MLRGLLHAIPTDPSLLHNKISKISIIVETKKKLIEDQRRKNLHILSGVFVAAMKFSPSRCLATKGYILSNICLVTKGAMHL